MRYRSAVGMMMATAVAMVGLWLMGTDSVLAGTPRVKSVQLGTVQGVPAPAPMLRSIEPAEVVGIGGKIRLRGTNLGTAQTTVVVFHPGVIAEQVERHTPNEIVVRVPVGAQTGNIQVVTGVNAAALRSLQTQIGVIEGCETPAIQAQVAQYKTQQIFMLSFGRFSNPIQRFVTAAYMNPKPSIRPVIDEVDGVKLVRNRLIVDLKDFLSFDVALQIADQLNAELVGHFPITNSYVLDLRQTPKDLKELDALMARVAQDQRVAEVWHDIVLELRQVRFADVDVVDRYRHKRDDTQPPIDLNGDWIPDIDPNNGLHGRQDAWATDRIQAPAAWNLIERFYRRNGRQGREALHPVKVAVFDTGCDQHHPEFDSVQLVQVKTDFVRVRIAGRENILPQSNFREEAYTQGERDWIDIDTNNDGIVDYYELSQHGTMVISLIGARNGNLIDPATGDRGINGLLHNPMQYTIQVYRSWLGPADPESATVAGWLATINTAAITGASVMNASLGVHHPNLGAPPLVDVQRALRKIAHQLNVFRDKLLLVGAAGNNAEGGAVTNFGEIEPFEDLNLNLQLDPGEDLNGNGRLDFGNDIPGSLGTLPNVISVGAIGGPDYGIEGWGRDDQRAAFSNWSAVRDANGFDAVVQLAAPGTDVFMAGRYAFDPDADHGNGNEIWFSFPIGGVHFVRNNGTSFAAPLVTGSAALLKAIDKDLSPAQLKQRLLASAFEVDTTDAHGHPLRWRTLKVGYAVRQLLVDRRVIGNDQPWTGVSKVVYDGLNMFEIRRGANGRAEGFALRRLTIDGRDPCLSHDGRKVAYIERLNEYNLREYHFDTDMEVTLVTRGRDRFTISSPIEYSPSNNLMWHLITSDGPCRRKHQLWVYKADGSGSDLIAETMMYNFCEFDPDRNPLEWRRYRLQKGSWRPDNRRWDLDYHYSKGRGDDILVICHSWWQDIRYPQGTLAFPECLTEEFYWSSWSPDGRARVGGRSIPAPSLDYYNLVTLYYDDAQDPYIVRATRSRVELRQEFPMFRAGWSPDGSEIIYLYDFSILNTIRRDRRNVDDRAPRRLIDQARGAATFSWQW
jgi:subtilisin family serine protease